MCVFMFIGFYQNNTYFMIYYLYYIFIIFIGGGVPLSVSALI